MSEMVVPAHHSFPAADGILVHGLLYRPTRLRAGAGVPVVVSVHGGPTAQATPRFNGPHQYLLARGIAVFDFNYRGSTGYGKTFARLNDRRLREHELADLRAAVAWLQQQEQIDGARVAIMGESYGGYLTMAALARLPDLFASGVAFVGVANWLTALEGALPQLKASDRVEYGDIDNLADREFFRQISPLAHVGNVRAPAMIIHGANDPRDPVTESDQFVRAIREHGGTVEYLRFPDEGHTIRKLSNRIIAYRRIAAFLEKTLGVSQEAPNGKPPN
jgi:dipeptidyl aminopeptidase/acylaminoacyl peptidase